MELKSKKLLAKEFVILIITLFLGVIFYSILFLYNLQLTKQVNSIKGEIQLQREVADSLNSIIDAKIQKQKWFYKEISKVSDVSRFKNYEDFWQRVSFLAQKDSLKFRWSNQYTKSDIENFRRIGFHDADSLQKFALYNEITKQEIEEKSRLAILIGSLEIELYEIDQILMSSKDQFRISRIFLFCLLLIVFLLRYIFKGLVWSYKILKE